MGMISLLCRMIPKEYPELVVLLIQWMIRFIEKLLSNHLIISIPMFNNKLINKLIKSMIQKNYAEMILMSPVWDVLEKNSWQLQLHVKDKSKLHIWKYKMKYFMPMTKVLNNILILFW